ncbi:transmembrane protein, putative (macronuclear) [Tetrahymena thermophila SB210]|uniref:Transmembrane protein, putative n=1 Tax=Tetrahymena thermophila (strain SB210) TaxID=312017 RepID=I7MAL2_TETTS|nr:transmembrane protein, putative [Tetrahymena thermophila SB210]EAS04812.3 transmembrane protein, putative [Tetrahymena thermophila SB210]|eukprot:XP_001025057.3 transmembrane protein, putative [Tetrahymena thermophila SB210]
MKISSNQFISFYRCLFVCLFVSEKQLFLFETKNINITFALFKIKLSQQRFIDSNIQKFREMLITFLFILSLTAVVVYASVMIWKTDYSQKEKKILIGILFGLLVLVIIVNEAKNQNYISFSLLGLHEADCSQKFFSILETQQNILTHKYPLLHMNFKHVPDQIKENFGNIDQMPEQIASSFFYLSISDENSGASHTMKHYAEQLQKNNIPVLYFRLTKQIKNAQDLENLLQIKGIEIIQKTIAKFNKYRNVIPFILIDNYQLAFNDGKDKENYSILTNLLVELYFQYQVKIILHTHNKNAITQIMQVPRIYQVLDIIKYKSISPQLAFEYIKEYYSESVKGVKQEQLQQIDDFVGLNYEILYKFTESFEKYQGEEQKFIESLLQEYQEILNKEQNLKDILYITKEVKELKQKVKSSNKIIHFSELKSKNIQNLLQLIDKYEQEGYLWIEQGYVNFYKPVLNSLFI